MLASSFVKCFSFSSYIDKIIDFRIFIIYLYKWTIYLGPPSLYYLADRKYFVFDIVSLPGNLCRWFPK